MRRLFQFSMTLALIALIVGPALAQEQPQGRGGRGRRGGSTNPVGGLLQNESVQKELKLDGGQISKIKEAVQTVDNKHKDDFAKLREAPQEDRREKGQELAKAVSEETLQAVTPILKPEQAKRLKQIQTQQAGSRAFSQPDVQQALKLTDDQKEKIKTIRDDADKAVREQFAQGRRGQGGQGGGGQGGREAMTKLRQETMDKTMAVLTEDQKKAWKDLTGEPFQIARGERRQRSQPNQ